ncbi:MAG TPA: hypothetical protein VFJ47_01610 [Terriglobales bacterium]|nr:hypothetical protein [Terriglobales bacterium]
MKHFLLLSLLLLPALLLGCGAGHPRITSIVVSPATAQTPVSANQTVSYTATAHFSNNTSRQLTVADGLTWATSSNTIAGINSDGTATCIAPGSVTITATAPSQLVVMVGSGISTNSPKVSGTASLNCT